MTEPIIKGPPDEQDLCVKCGFCCDGTIFMHAVLNRGEKGNLPEKIEQNYFKENDKEYFRLPCPYFDRKCTIYDKRRAHVCLSYRCQLLKDFADKKISRENALSMIEKMMSTRDELIRLFNEFSENDKVICFRQLLLNLEKVEKTIAGNNHLSLNFDILIARCNIFEAQLIKHFRSVGDFESLVVGNEK
jgi:hypothetical protein